MTRRGTIVAALVILALAGCGGDDEDAGKAAAVKPNVVTPEALLSSEDTRKADPDAGEEIPLGADAAIDPLAAREVTRLTNRKSGPDGFGGTDTSVEAYDRFIVAIVPEIERFWRKETKRLTPRARYEPPERAVSYDGANSPGCGGRSGEAMANNAYFCDSVAPFQKCKKIAPNRGYCASDDLIAWDKSGFMYPFFKRIGDLSVALVMAHEWGHLMQSRLYPEFHYQRPLRFELQADCFSGAWALDQRRQGRTTVGEFNDAIELFYEIGGGQKAWLDEESHGNKFQRTRTFIQGFEQGAKGCVGATFDRVLRNLGVNREKRATLADLGRGPKAPPGAASPTIRGSSEKSLEAFMDEIGEDADAWWKQLFTKSGFKWAPVRQVVVDGSVPTGCGTHVTTERSLWCGDDDATFFGLEYFKDKIQPVGDAAVALTVGRMYAVGALERLNYLKGLEAGRYRLIDITTSTMCLTGVWFASLAGRIEPGDVEEASKITIDFADKPGDPPSKGTQQQLAEAFDRGFKTRKAGGCTPKPRG